MLWPHHLTSPHLRILCAQWHVGQQQSLSTAPDHRQVSGVLTRTCSSSLFRHWRSSSMFLLVAPAFFCLSVFSLLIFSRPKLFWRSLFLLDITGNVYSMRRHSESKPHISLLYKTTIVDMATNYWDFLRNLNTGVYLSAASNGLWRIPIPPAQEITVKLLLDARNDRYKSIAISLRL